jgi:dihydroneopterin aldolase
MDKIGLQRMKFYGYHGVFPEETRLGQRYEVDLELFLNLEQAVMTDSIDDTVNYAAVYELVKQMVEGTPYQLVETLAGRIADMILRTFAPIEEVTVRLYKPNPPVPVIFEGFFVELHRKRKTIR